MDILNPLAFLHLRPEIHQKTIQMQLRNISNICLSVVILLVGNSLFSQSTELKLQAAIDAIFAAHPTSAGIMVHVEAPEKGISWSGASGYANKETKTKLEPDQPALIASSIKTYVAASILRLVEEDLLSIEDPIATLVNEKTRRLFEEDEYDFSAIAVKHLLSHTSGIADYATEAYIDYKNEHPNYRWTRDEQLALAIKVGDPLGAPGAQFSYADANYLLLTEIIENQTKLPFYQAMRQLLKYEALGINHTWFPTLEDTPQKTKEMVHQYWGAYGWDSADMDISWDLYGGGGIACPTKDLAQFIYHYFNGNIVEDEAIQNLIFTELRTKATELYPYYLGLSQDHYHGMNAYGHGGFWGTVMLYFPTINTAVSVYILERDKRGLRRDVLETVSAIMLEEHRQRQNQNEPINAYLEKLTDFSGTILVAQNDEVITEKAYGLANIEGSIENKIDTKFNLASISKLITSIAVLQLHEQGNIDLQEVVGTYLPDYPNPTVRDSVSLHQLLTHTSGIPPFYGKKYLQNDKLRYQRIADYVPLFQQEELRFKPGEEYQYTGSGFVLLGRIIEEVSGMDYYDYIAENIFKKAGMKNSLAIPTDSIVINKANGYTCLWGDQDYLSRNDYYISKASPAGGHYSTVQDLFLFSKAFRNGTLINEESKVLLTTPKVKGYNTHLGYGIDIDQRYDERIIGHSGGWFGVRTELMDFMASGYTVVVLSNQDDDGKSGASKVIEDLRQIIAGEKI